MDPLQCRPELPERLGAIGPYELQGKSVWANPLVPCFQGYSVCTNGTESLSYLSPETRVLNWGSSGRFLSIRGAQKVW